ncbi:MAG: asparagine synthase-related protein [Aliidongia sp.]
MPLGLFLSGGLDSSSVLWAAAQHRTRRVDRELYHRLHRAVLRRIRSCLARRRVFRHAASREDAGHGDGARPRAGIARAARRAARRRVAIADLFAQRVHPRMRHRRPVGRWRRRALCRLRSVQGADAGALLSAG